MREIATDVFVTCSHCGRQYNPTKAVVRQHKNYPNTLYCCSRPCQQSYAQPLMVKRRLLPRTEKSCVFCGDGFTVIKSTAHRKYCSRECRSEHLKEIMRGHGPRKPPVQGTRRKNKTGYIEVYMPSHPMAKWGGWMLEHRLIMSQHLGRTLLGTETVHHIDGVRDNNRVENLRLASPADHVILSRVCSMCYLRKEVGVLHRRIRELALQAQMRLDWEVCHAGEAAQTDGCPEEGT